MSSSNCSTSCSSESLSYDSSSSSSNDCDFSSTTNECTTCDSSSNSTYNTCDTTCDSSSTYNTIFDSTYDSTNECTTCDSSTCKSTMCESSSDTTCDSTLTCDSSSSDNDCNTSCESTSNSNCSSSLNCTTTCDSSSICSSSSVCDSSTFCQSSTFYNSSTFCDDSCSDTDNDPCDSNCDLSCDVPDDSEFCYDPTRRIKSCSDNCSSNECKQTNIYWFGASLTDIGYGSCELGLRPYKITTLLNACENPIQVGYGPCARNSDDKVYPQFIAEDYDFKIKMGRDLWELPKYDSNLISFAITGATQLSNITPNIPSTYSYTGEVDNFLKLYNKSKCYAVPEQDLFLYTDVGENEFFQLINLLLSGSGPLDVNAWFQDNLVNPVLANVTRLYSEGKVRNMIVQLIDGDTIRRLPAYQKLQCIANIDELIDIYNANILDLQTKLNNFAQTQVPHFNLTVLLSGPMYDSVLNNSNTYGVVNGPTMIDLGWPNQIFSNQAFFDDLHPSSHTNRVFANYVKTWFQQRLC